MTETHVTALTKFVETDGTRFAYRRFGAGRGVPLLFIQHYRAGMDHWDPAVTDGFAASRAATYFSMARRRTYPDGSHRRRSADSKIREKGHQRAEG
jgi:hypothetical protein